MTAAIGAAAAGFLIAVVWFDLMFDVQVFGHRRSELVPNAVLDSISAYYRRVTTTASPMGRPVGLVMAVLLVDLIVQAATEEAEVWQSAASFVAAATGIGLAAVRVFARARRLGAANDSRDVQSELARSIFRDHVVCLLAMAVLLGVQLSAV